MRNLKEIKKQIEAIDRTTHVIRVIFKQSFIVRHYVAYTNGTILNHIKKFLKENLNEECFIESVDKRDI